MLVTTMIMMRSTMSSYSRWRMPLPILPSILPSLPILPFTNHPFSLTPGLALPPPPNPPPKKQYWQPPSLPKEAQG